jgi:hypothetical protein
MPLNCFLKDCKLLKPGCSQDFKQENKNIMLDLGSNSLLTGRNSTIGYQEEFCIECTFGTDAIVKYDNIYVV